MGAVDQVTEAPLPTRAALPEAPLSLTQVMRETCRLSDAVPASTMNSCVTESAASAVGNVMLIDGAIRS